VADVAGAGVLVVSQFTFVRRHPKGAAAVVERGRRPGGRAAGRRVLRAPDSARRCRRNRVFGADMRVELVNDGPITLILDS